MTLAVTGSPATGMPTRLTIKSDRRVTPAVSEVREDAVITVATAGEEQVWNATRVVTAGQPRKVAPITITDSRGVEWVPESDDGVTAVYVPA